MRYFSSSSDYFYTSSADTLNYYITVEGDDAPIFEGRAVKNPSSALLEINVGRIVRDYLETNMPDFRDFNGVVVPHPRQLRRFNLYTDSMTLLAEYTVLMEYTRDWDADYGILSEPVNGRADWRQKLMLSFLLDTGKTVSVQHVGCAFGFFPAYLEITGVSRCHTEHVIDYESDYTGLTASADVDWIEIKSVTDSSITFDTWYIPYTTRDGYRSGVWGTISILRNNSAYKVAEFRVKKYSLGTVEDATVRFSYAGGSGSTPSLWVCEGEMYATSSEEWVSPVYHHTSITGAAVVDYEVDRNYGDEDRTAVISVYLSDGTLVQTITILQTLADSVDGRISFWQDEFDTDDPCGHTVMICGGVPIGYRTFDAFAIPQSGHTANAVYSSTVSVFDAVIRKDGVVIRTERVFPVLHEWNHYMFTVGANTGSTKIEYSVMFKNLLGKTLAAIYYVQPPEVPAQYEARDILSGSSGFEFYRTNSNTKNTYDSGAAAGVYFETDADAQADGYPVYGGYPTSAVTELGGYSDPWSTAISEVMTYVQSTSPEFDFEFTDGDGTIGPTCYSGLSAPNVSVMRTGWAKEYYATGVKNTLVRVPKYLEFLDVPRAITLDDVSQHNVGYDIGFTNKTINEINAYSLAYIGRETFRYISGLTEVYLPNICCIDNNNFYDMPDLTDVYLGNSLRFLGCRFDHAESHTQNLPDGVTFHYLGTMQEFRDKVVFAPNGTYYCSDGDLTISFAFPCNSDYYQTQYKI